MNNKISMVLLLVIIILCGTFGVLGYSMQQDIKNAQEELTVNKELIQYTINELETTKNNLNNEIKKSEELNAELIKAKEIISSREGETYFVDYKVTEYEINMIAKTVLGEAGGSDKLEQSAVVWCILNRVDAGWGTIAKVITKKDQFHGYNSGWAVRDDIKELVEDVIARWKLEKICCGDVGRTLPKEYLYFRSKGDGVHNIYRTEWNGNYKVWDWNCYNPYS